MNKLNCYIVIINIVIVAAGCQLFGLNLYAQSQTNASELAPEIAEILSNAPPPPPGFVTKLDYLKSFTNRSDLEKAYHARIISREEAMLATEMDKLAPEDKASMDTYGKVVNQDGRPVVDAKVRGFLEFKEMNIDEEHDTTTDAQGRFQFLGLHGKGLAMVPEKEGFEFNSNILPNVNRPSNYLPNPDSPLIFTMWKLRGPEPMKHIQMHSYISCDGGITRFDLLTGKKDTDGDFSVSLSRSPTNIAPNKPFNWSVTFEVTNGGLKGITNIYPYEAPLDGYQSRITFDFPTNAPQWSSLFTPSFYFKSKDGNVFGRMTIKIMANFQPPPTLFDAEIYANPGGSRILEFDPKKQIMN
jgi:hypothetical protein